MRCPSCRSENPPGSERRLFVEASCPVCLDQKQPFLSLPCGHGVCEECMDELGKSNKIATTNRIRAVARSPAQVTEHIEIPEHSKGKIIGKGGRVLKDMQRRPGIGQVSLRDSTLTIRGEADAVEALKYSVTHILEPRQGTNANDNGLSEEQISVPEWAIGRILGRGGGKIREFQEYPGISRVSLTDGTIKLCGSQASVATVLAKIRELVPRAEEDEVEEVKIIQEAAVPLIIGRNGEFMQELKSIVGVRIVNFHKSNLLIIGKENGVRVAMTQVQAMINRSALDPSSRRNYVVCFDAQGFGVRFERCTPTNVALPRNLQKCELYHFVGVVAQDRHKHASEEALGSVQPEFCAKSVAKALVSSLPNSRPATQKLVLCSRIGCLCFRDFTSSDVQQMSSAELSSLKVGVDLKCQFVAQLLLEVKERMVILLRKEDFEEMDAGDQCSYKLQVVDHQTRTNYSLNCRVSKKSEHIENILACKVKPERVCIVDVVCAFPCFAHRLACTVEADIQPPEGLLDFLRSLKVSDLQGKASNNRYSIDSIRRKQFQVFSNGIVEFTLAVVKHEAIGNDVVQVLEVDISSSVALDALEKVYHGEPSANWVRSQKEAIREVQHLVDYVHTFLKRLLEKGSPSKKQRVG